jgi:putative glutamine amidotransferase
MPRRKPPLIGLSTYGRSADGRFSLPGEYVDAVRRAGGIPLLIAPGESNWEQALEVIDAFVLTGGGDIDPQRYAGRVHELNYGIDHERDHLELAIARWLIDSGTPTLGICRGAQILNIVEGGTLIEHIPEEVGESILHRAPRREPIPHAIHIKAGSRLLQILGQEEVEAASWHHQALRRVARGFEVAASAPDGIVEAIEMPRHPWLIAVQWHPELTAASDPVQQRLFDAVVQAALARPAQTP